MKKHQLKLIVVILIIIILAVIMTVAAVLLRTKKTMVKEQCDNAQAVAVAMAADITRDIESYEKFLNILDVNNDYYKEMHKYFMYVKDTGGLTFLYTINLVDNQNAVYVLSAEPTDGEYYSLPGEKDDYYTMQSHIKLFNMKLPLCVAENYPKYGYIVTGYAGIYNKTGKLSGIVGADFDETHLVGAINEMIFVSAITLLVVVIIIAFLMVKLMPYLINPILKDHLTGAYNKKAFEEKIQHEIQKMLKKSNNMAVLMLDVDHFKKINDTYGHPFGDKVLTHVARLITDSIRKYDFFVRYGGEEFVVILTRTSLEDVKTVSERIRQTIENSPVFNEKIQDTIRFTVSIGVAIPKTIKVSIDELINTADKALYRAKIRRNDVILYEIGVENICSTKDSV